MQPKTYQHITTVHNHKSARTKVINEGSSIY